jgi:hypothetical protein
VGLALGRPGGETAVNQPTSRFLITSHASSLQSGHATAAPPTSVMNSRHFNWSNYIGPLYEPGPASQYIQSEKISQRVVDRFYNLSAVGEAAPTSELGQSLQSHSAPVVGR